jgi:hypothetical protein
MFVSCHGNTTSVTSGTGTATPSGAHVSTHAKAVSFQIVVAHIVLVPLVVAHTVLLPLVVAHTLLLPLALLRLSSSQ